jgi:hypothetical protein
MIFGGYEYSFPVRTNEPSVPKPRTLSSLTNQSLLLCNNQRKYLYWHPTAIVLGCVFCFSNHFKHNLNCLILFLHSVDNLRIICFSKRRGDVHSLWWETNSESLVKYEGYMNYGNGPTISNTRALYCTKLFSTVRNFSYKMHGIFTLLIGTCSVSANSVRKKLLVGNMDGFEYNCNTTKCFWRECIILIGMSTDMKFYIDMELFYRFRKLLLMTVVKNILYFCITNYRI